MKSFQTVKTFKEGNMKIMKKTITILMALILAQTSFCNPHHSSGSVVAAGIIGLASGIIIGSTVQTPPPPPVTYVQYPQYVTYPSQTVVVQPVQTTVIQQSPVIVGPVFPPPSPRPIYRPLPPPPPRFLPPPRHYFSAPPPPPSRRMPSSPPRSRPRR